MNPEYKPFYSQTLSKLLVMTSTTINVGTILLLTVSPLGYARLQVETEVGMGIKGLTEKDSFKMNESRRV